MTDFIDILRRDEMVTQHYQAPAFLSVGWRRADSGNKKRFCRTIENTGFAVVLLASKDSRVKAVNSEAAAHLFDSGVAHTDGFLNGFILFGSFGAGRVCQQKNASALAFPFGMLIRASDDFCLVTLVVGQRYMMFLGGHGGFPRRRFQRGYLKSMPEFYLDPLLVPTLPPLQGADSTLPAATCLLLEEARTTMPAESMPLL